MLQAIECEAFAETCLSELFSLSRRFSQIRVLNLRGLINMSKAQLVSVISSCDAVAHLNLSFIKAVE